MTRRDGNLEGRDLLLGRSAGSAGGAQQEELLREILAAVRRAGDDPALAKDVQALLSAVNAIGESLSRSGRDAEELKSAVRELAKLVEDRPAGGADPDIRKAFEETVEAGRKRIRQEIDWSMSLHVAKVRGAVRGLFFGRVTAAVLAVSFLILTGVQLQHRFGFLKPDDPPLASLIIGTGIKPECE